MPLLRPIWDLGAARQMMERRLIGRGCLLEIAGADRSCHRTAARLRGHDRRDARGHAAGGAQDRWRAQAARDDREGAVSGGG